MANTLIALKYNSTEERFDAVYLGADNEETETALSSLEESWASFEDLGVNAIN